MSDLNQLPVEELAALPEWLVPPGRKAEVEAFKARKRRAAALRTTEEEEQEIVAARLRAGLEADGSRANGLALQFLNPKQGRVVDATQRTAPKMAALIGVISEQVRASFLAGSLLLFLPAANADMRDAFKRQERAEEVRNSCRFFDDAQWQKVVVWDQRSKPLISSGRIFVSRGGTIFGMGENLSGLMRTGERTEPRSCYRESEASTSFARRMGTHIHFYKDGSGSRNQTVVEGDYLVTYISDCSKWKCSAYILKKVLGLKIGSATYYRIQAEKSKGEWLSLPEDKPLQLPPRIKEN